MSGENKRLNAGCGNDILKGYVNLDCADLPGVDVVHDLNKLPLPFSDEEFSEILCNDVIEHIDYIVVLKEFHRILEPGGLLKIRVPHFTSRDNFADPTHKNRFSIKTFEFFVENSSFGRGYYFDFAFKGVYDIRLSFRKGVFLYNYLVEFIVNSHYKIQNVYEMTGLGYLFPAADLHVTLKKQR